MNFEWDPEKAEANLRKHRVEFAAATGVFFDPYRTEELSAGDFNEERWIVIGRTQDTILAVIFTVRGNNIRIISAGKGTPSEHNKYWTGQV